MNLSIILPAAMLACCIGICLAVRSYYRRKTEVIYQNLLEKLDRILSNGSRNSMSYDESMDSAVAERLNRIMQIAEKNQDQAERERDIIKSLISDISHQVRTPLTNILLYTGLLKEKDSGQDEGILIEKIQLQSQKLEFFMKQLMKSSYAESEMITIQPERVNVSEIVYTSCQLQELAAMKKKIVLQQTVTDDFCYADRKWTIEAVSNVIENSIKYSPENSVIEIKVIPYEAFIAIQIKDSGIGIREEEQGKVYERFYRSADVSREPGFGIGLYLVREILRRQGGYSKISSTPGQGTVISILLSRYQVN